MKLFSIFLIALVLHGSSVVAQPTQERRRTTINSQDPYVLVDSFQTDLKYLILDAGKIRSIDILKDSSAINHYGDKGRNGVILIHLEENTKLLRLPAFLKAYSVPDSLWNLRVSINEVIVNNPALVLIDPSSVESIKAHVMLRWPDARTNEEETFLNITQKKKAGSQKVD